MQEYERLLTYMKELATAMEIKTKSERCGYLTVKGTCTYKGDCHQWTEGEGCSRHRKK